MFALGYERPNVSLARPITDTFSGNHPVTGVPLAGSSGGYTHVVLTASVPTFHPVTKKPLAGTMLPPNLAPAKPVPPRFHPIAVVPLAGTQAGPTTMTEPTPPVSMSLPSITPAQASIGAMMHKYWILIATAVALYAAWAAWRS